MELKPGYKKTEVGVIPGDWEVDHLDRFWSVTDCKHVTAEFIANGYPLASIREVQSRFIDLTESKQTTQHFYNLLSEGGRKPKAGDIILSRNATVGEVAQVAEWHPPFAMGQDVCLLRKKSPELSTDYLQAVFQSPIIRQQLSDLMVGSTFKRANVLQIRNFTVPMPAPSEQIAIAEALSDADALIESLDQLIAKKRLIKQGTMQELLTGKRRLPGFSGEWEVKRLGSVLKFQVGFPFSSIYFNETGQGIRLVKNRDLKSDDQIIYYSGGYGDNFLVKNGDVLIGMDGDFLPCLWSKGVSLLNQRVGRILPLNGLSNLYAFYFLIQPLKDIENVTLSTTVKHLSHGDIEGIEKPLPTLDEQIAIATFLSDMDAELAALESRLAKARQIKQGMMQELLTGRIRLL